MKIGKCIKILTLSALLFSMGCSSLGYSPTVNITPIKPVVARDLSGYQDKRAVVLAFKEPSHERGLGKWFSSLVFTELLAAGPFASVGNHSEVKWFSLQSSSSQELSIAAQMGRELGYDLAVVAEVERFIYGRTASSVLLVNFHVIDTTKGEVIHSRRVKAEGTPGYVPPFWDASLNKPVHRDDLFQSVAIDFVKGLHIDWSNPVDEVGDRDYEQTEQ